MDNYEKEIKSLTNRNNEEEMLNVVSDYIFNVDTDSKEEVMKDTIEEEIELEKEEIHEEETHLDNEVVSVEEAIDFDTDVVSMQAIDVMKRVVEALDIDKDNIITVENDKDDIFLDDKSTEEEDEKKNILTKEVPMTEEDIFKDIDPFLDDNMFEKKEDSSYLNDTTGLEMPDIDKIGSVKPTSTLSKIENITKDNSNLVLPTLGLINNTKEVSLVSDNYLS